MRHRIKKIPTLSKLNHKFNHHLLHSDKSTYTYFYKGKVRDFFKSRLTPTQPCTNGVRYASPHCDKVNTPTVSTLANRTQRSQDITPYSAVAGRANRLGNSRFSTIPLVLSAFGLLLVLGVMVISPVGTGGEAENAYATDPTETTVPTTSGQSTDAAPSIALTLPDYTEEQEAAGILLQEQVDSSSNVGSLSIDFNVKATNIDKYDVYVQSASSALVGEANGGRVESISSDTTYTNMQNQAGWGYAVAKGSKVNAETLTYKPIQTSVNTSADSGTASDTSIDQTYTLAFAANLTGAKADHYKSNITLSIAAGATQVMTLYSVTYNTNGSTGGAIPATQTAESDATAYTFTAPTAEQYGLVKTGYGLVGWSERPNTTAPTYEPNSTIRLTKDNSNIALYAVWSNLNLITTMQEMYPAICTNANVNDTKQLIDTRDNKSYWITKLSDGNCWMTQNLAIDLTGKTLTSTDSDVSSNWSPTSSWGTANNTIAWQISTTGSEHGSYGGYYTWQAATAGTAPTNTGEAPSSICPKGWRLPISNTTADKSFGKLLNGLNTTTIKAAPYYYIYGGHIYNGSLNDAGSNGYYWSSTAQSASHAFDLNFNSSIVNPSNNHSRCLGLSVRCVAR